MALVKVFTFRLPDSSEPCVRIAQMQNAPAVIDFATEEFLPAAKRWISGLSEWIETDNIDGRRIRSARITQANHPEFLERLRDYLINQGFNYFYEIRIQ